MSEQGGSGAAETLAELRNWIGGNWDPELSLAAWRQRLADSGWACPDWPADCCGRGLPAAVAAQAAAAMAAARIPGPPEGVGVALAAPVIIEYGGKELQRRLVRPTVTAELMWCQLFSEPGAGSDLAGLSTRAEPDGAGGWLVTGQKVWSTGAATADFGLLLARTDVDVPKHEGITAFALPMRQPGVQVRPLRQMNGHASFNEVFLDGARVPAGNVIGQPGDGWRVARATLARERRLAPSVVRPAQGAGPGAPGASTPRPAQGAVRPAQAAASAASGASTPQPGVDVPKGSFFPAHRFIDAAIMAGGTGASGDAAEGRAWREAIAERVAAAEPHKWYPQRAGRADLVTERARAEGRAADPLVRQEIARLTELAWSARWTAARAAAARAAGQAPGPEGSLGKLASSRIAEQAARVHSLIAGPSAMLTGTGSPLDGVIAEITLSVPAISIAGGTDEIQRTIIAERILGLPREPDTARDLPFRDLPHNG